MIWYMTYDIWWIMTKLWYIMTSVARPVHDISWWTTHNFRHPRFSLHSFPYSHCKIPKGSNISNLWRKIRRLFRGKIPPFSWSNHVKSTICLPYLLIWFQYMSMFNLNTFLCSTFSIIFYVDTTSFLKKNQRCTLVYITYYFMFPWVFQCRRMAAATCNICPRACATRTSREWRRWWPPHGTLADRRRQILGWSETGMDSDF